MRVVETVESGRIRGNQIRTGIDESPQIMLIRMPLIERGDHVDPLCRWRMSEAEWTRATQ